MSFVFREWRSKNKMISEMSKFRVNALSIVYHPWNPYLPKFIETTSSPPKFWRPIANTVHDLLIGGGSWRHLMAKKYYLGRGTAPSWHTLFNMVPWELVHIKILNKWQGSRASRSLLGLECAVEEVKASYDCRFCCLVWYWIGNGKDEDIYKQGSQWSAEDRLGLTRPGPSLV